MSPITAGRGCIRTRIPRLALLIALLAGCATFRPATPADLALQDRVELRSAAGFDLLIEPTSGTFAVPPRCRLTLLRGRLAAVSGDTLRLASITTGRSMDPATPCHHRGAGVVLASRDPGLSIGVERISLSKTAILTPSFIGIAAFLIFGVFITSIG